MVNFSLDNYSILEKISLLTGCFAIIFSIVTFVYVLLSRSHWPTHFWRTHLAYPVVNVILSVFLILGVVVKMPALATPFVCGNIAGLFAAITIGVYVLIKKLGVQKYIKMTHQGIMKNTDSDIPEERLSTALKYMALVIYILPAIYSVVGLTYYCYYTYSKVKDD